MSERSSQIPNVVPLSALRHRQAVQYCFAPGYDVDGPVPRKKRTIVASSAAPSICSQGDEAVVQYLRYPSENYETEVTQDELRYFRQHCSERAAKFEKMKKKAAASAPAAAAPKKVIPAPPKALPRGGPHGKLGVKERAALAAEEERQHRERAMSEYLCIGTGEPVVELPFAHLDEYEDTDDGEDYDTNEVAAVPTTPTPTPQEQKRSVALLSVDDITGTATSSRPATAPTRAANGPRKLLRTKSQLQRPKLSLEDNDSQKTVVDAQSGHPRTMRRLVYIRPPQENIPAWLPVVGMPEAPSPSKTGSLRRHHSSASMTSPIRHAVSLHQLVAPPPSAPPTAVEKSGRFSPNGGFYVPATMDDEYYCAGILRQAKATSDATQHRPSAAEQAQQATFDRLARPNVVSEASTTAEEGRLLRFLAGRRESITPSAATAAAAVAGSPPAGNPPVGFSPQIKPQLAVGNATPPAGSSLLLQRSPPLPPMSLADAGLETPRAAATTRTVTFAAGTSPAAPSAAKPTPIKGPQEDATDALLTYRQLLPNNARSSGCVGAAEIHYWLDMSQQGKSAIPQRREQDACVAQVWMRRSLTEECHSARTVLRNYATRIPRDAVLAVTLREVSFGHRNSDITITFSYGDCLRDAAMAPVAETIRKIVKDANNSDTARFRGPFLMCSASASLCTYLRSYCTAMSSAEHPELAVLGFPGAHSTFKPLSISDDVATPA